MYRTLNTEAPIGARQWALPVHLESLVSHPAHTCTSRNASVHGMDLGHYGVGD